MKNSKYVLTGLMLTAILAGAVFYIREINPVAPVMVSQSGQKSKGPVSAPIQIVEYSDFQCPACQKAEPVLQQIFSQPEYRDKIRFVFRHYPLPGHRWASLAHQAAECAHQEKRFWDYHDRLYAEQAQWSALENPMETFLRYAQELSLPLESFGLCLANPDIRRRVLEDRNKGDAMRIQSTPTFFMNGERLVGHIELQMKGTEIIRKTLGLPALPAPPPPAASPPSPLQTPS